MVDPKKVKKWVVSSTVAGVIFTTPLTGYAAVGDQTAKAAKVNEDTEKPRTVQSTSGKTSNTLILRLGSRGPEVVNVQKKLKALGYYTYKIDGIYGPITANAVKKFQKQKKLVVDGIVGPKTLKAFGQVKTGDQARQPSSTTASLKLANRSSTSTLKIGSQGPAVTDLQKRLKAIGQFPHAVDGVFGPLTDRAVKNFQRQYGLFADGIVGPQTLSKLQSVSKGNHVDNTGSDKPKNAQEKPTNRQGFNAIQLVADASKLLGAPYVWGGVTPSGFDCSGFIVYVFKQQGVQLPRTVAQMWDYGKAVSRPNVGDVVFFETYQEGPSHAGIYVGNNQFIQSGTSTGVTVSDMNASYWKSRYLGAKRLH